MASIAKLITVLEYQSVGAEHVGRGLDAIEKSAIKVVKAHDQIAESAAKAEKSLTATYSNVRSKLEGMFESPTKAASGLADVVGTDLTGSLASVAGVAAGAAAAVGVVAVACFHLAEGAAGVGAELDDMSEISGVSVERLSQLKFAADVTGHSLPQLTNAIFAMQQRMEENPKEFEQGLKRLNISVREFENLTPDEKFIAISNGFRQATPDVNKAAAAVELFSRQGRDLLPLLSKPLDDLMAKSRELGLVWSGEDAAAAEQFEEQINLLKIEAKSFGVSIGKELIPPILDLLRYLETPVKMTAGTVAWFLSGGAPKASTSGQFIDPKLNDAIEQARKLAGAPMPNLAGVTFDLKAGNLPEQLTRITELQTHLEQLRTPIVALTAEQRQWAQAMDRGGDSTADIARWLGVADKAVKHFLDTQKKSTEETKKQTEEALKYRDALLGIAPTEMAHLVEIQKIIDMGPLQVDVHERVVKAMAEMIAKGEEIPPMLKAWYDQNHEIIDQLKLMPGYLQKAFTPGLIEDLSSVQIPRINSGFGETAQSLYGVALRTKEWNDKQTLVNGMLHEGTAQTTTWGHGLGDLTQAFAQLAQISGGTFGGIVQLVGKGIASLNIMTTAAKNLKAATKGSLDEYVAAFSLVYAYAQAIAPIVNAFNTKTGANAFYNHIATDVPRLSALTNQFASLGEMFHHTDLSAEEFGRTMAILLLQVKSTPAEWNASFKTMQDSLIRTKAEADALTRAIEHYNLTWKDMADPGQREKGFKAQFDGLISDFNRLYKAGYSTDAIMKAMGPDFIASLRAANSSGVLKGFLDHLVTMGRLSQTAADNLLKIGKSVDYEELTQRASTYGITLEQLGPKFQQAASTKSAETLLTDFNDLIGAGAEINGVMIGMSGQVNTLLQNATKFGLSIPTAMKPMLQTMLDAGLLVDINGDKLKDLSGITFADSPLEQGLNDLTQAIRDLISTLGGVPTALQNIGNTKVPPIRIGVEYDYAPFNPDPRDKPNTLHAGGIIERMHQGRARILPFLKAHNGLAPGEVPIIALEGEAVLNRQAVNGLGTDTIRALNNNGGALGSSTSDDATVQELRALRADLQGAREPRQPVVLKFVMGSRVIAEQVIDDILQDTNGIRRVIRRVATGGA